MIIDAFPFNDELDLLEMRLTELEGAVDFHLAVEADVDHQGHPKPYHLTEDLNAYPDLWRRWKNLLVVRATDLPSVDEFPDAWAREHAQREWIGKGIDDLLIDANSRTVVLQSDVDEIPRALHARNVRPPRHKLWAFQQRGHFWAVDWFYPLPWMGTVAGQLGTIRKLGPNPWASMRTMRTIAESPPFLDDAGWHFSWLGGPERARKKVGSFCHPEVLDQIEAGIADELSFWRDGIHVDGVKMEPVDVDEGWPKWIRAGNAPSSWYRPR